MNLQPLVLQVWLQTHTCAKSHARPREKTQIPQFTWRRPSWEDVSSMASSRTTHVCAQRTCLLHGISHCAGTFVSAPFVGRRCWTRRTRGRTWETAVALAPWMRTLRHPCDTDDLRFASNIFICRAMTRMSSSTRSMSAVYELPSQVLLRASVTRMLVSSNAALHLYTRSASHYVPQGNFTLGHRVPYNKSRNMKRNASTFTVVRRADHVVVSARDDAVLHGAERHVIPSRCLKRLFADRS